MKQICPFINLSVGNSECAKHKCAVFVSLQERAPDNYWAFENPGYDGMCALKMLAIATAGIAKSPIADPDQT